jgi:signal transduction histidine kinase
LVFDSSEKKLIILTLLAPLSFYLGLELTQYRAVDLIFHVSSEHLNVDKQITGLANLIIFTVVSTTTYLFSLQSGKYEKQIKNTNEVLDVLIKTVVHDIRNPLTVCKGYAKILQAKQGESSDKSVDGILKASEQIERIINGIVEIHRLKSEKMKFEMQPVNLRDVFEECVFAVQPQLTQKNIELKLNSFEQIRVWSNPTILTQSVINNVLTNAIKFSSEGSTIGISVEKTGQDFALVRIKDHGIGMSPDNLKNIFDRSVDSHRAGTQKEKGFGFGLTIAKSYLEAMGGEMQVISKSIERNPDDHGTEFQIKLKAA